MVFYLDEELNKSMVEEVFAYFIRGNSGTNAKLLLNDEVIKAYMDCYEIKENFDNLREVEKKHKHLLYKLNFYYKARVVLPIIFDIPVAECKKQLLAIMDNARKALLIKRANFKYSNKIKEAELITQLEAKNTRIDRKNVNAFFQELVTRVKKSDPMYDEEYQRAMQIIEDTPESVFDQGIYDEKYHNASSYVDRVYERFQVNKKLLDTNKKYWDEIKDFDDEKLLLEDELFLTPSLFEENNLGFDISKLKIRESFASFYAKQMGKNIFIEDLEQWEYEILKSVNAKIQRRIDREDEHGNIQLTIDDIPNQNEENE